LLTLPHIRDELSRRNEGLPFYSSATPAKRWQFVDGGNRLLRALCMRMERGIVCVRRALGGLSLFALALCGWRFTGGARPLTDY